MENDLTDTFFNNRWNGLTSIFPALYQRQSGTIASLAVQDV